MTKYLIEGVAVTKENALLIILRKEPLLSRRGAENILAMAKSSGELGFLKVYDEKPKPRLDRAKRETRRRDKTSRYQELSQQERFWKWSKERDLHERV